MKNYFYLDASQNVQGPISSDQLEELYYTGVINSTTQVCEEGSEDWVPYSEWSKARKKSTDFPQNNNKDNFSNDNSAKIKLQENTFKGITQWQGDVLIVILIIGMGVLLKPKPKPKPAPEWEYQTLEILAEGRKDAYLPNDKNLSFKSIPNIEDKLNRVGAGGWELVSVYLEMETAHPNFGKEDYVNGLQPNIRPQSLVCIFKREKKNSSHGD